MRTIFVPARNLLLETIHYALLIQILVIASELWIMENTAVWITRHPKNVTGTTPIGAIAAVKQSAKYIIWTTARIRKAFKPYVQRRHPRMYNYCKKIFQ